ncbi:MAG: precorrin-4 C(11)-methyltransferase [Pseudomonadota bacterium]
MTIHFIGAGPGDPELITVRGRRLIQEADVVLYAGSLVPVEVVACARSDARVVDTAPMALEEFMTIMFDAHAAGEHVARVHSGDPSLYGAIGEQIRQLNERGIPYDITPGVPAYAAAAAVLGTELTLPNVSQTVILTRTSTLSSPMPNDESLETLGASGATLAIHLSIRALRDVCERLVPHYGEECPAVVLYRASWPDQQIVRGTLGTIHELTRPLRLRRTALILVGHVLGDGDFDDSKLYDASFAHLLRPARRNRA